MSIIITSISIAQILLHLKLYLNCSTIFSYSFIFLFFFYFIALWVDLFIICMSWDGMSVILFEILGSNL